MSITNVVVRALSCIGSTVIALYVIAAWKDNKLPGKIMLCMMFACTVALNVLLGY